MGGARIGSTTICFPCRHYQKKRIVMRTRGMLAQQLWPARKILCSSFRKKAATFWARHPPLATISPSLLDIFVFECCDQQSPGFLVKTIQTVGSHKPGIGPEDDHWVSNFKSFFYTRILLGYYFWPTSSIGNFSWRFHFSGLTSVLWRTHEVMDDLYVTHKHLTFLTAIIWNRNIILLM